MDEDILRARRNLVAISVVLILFDFAKVSIGEVSVLGTNLAVGNPEVVHSFLWVLLGYFLLRYSQHLADKGDLGIDHAFHQKAESKLYWEIDARVKAHDPARTFCNYGYPYLRRIGFLRWDMPIQWNDLAAGQPIPAGSVSMPGDKIIAAYLLAAIHVVVMRPHATDYIAPFALAIVAPLVGVFG